jgi:hypothetical protein
MVEIHFWRLEIGANRWLRSIFGVGRIEQIDNQYLSTKLGEVWWINGHDNFN